MKKLKRQFSKFLAALILALSLAHGLNVNIGITAQAQSKGQLQEAYEAAKSVHNMYAEALEQLEQAMTTGHILFQGSVLNNIMQVLGPIVRTVGSVIP